MNNELEIISTGAVAIISASLLFRNCPAMIQDYHEESQESFGVFTAV